MGLDPTWGWLGCSGHCSHLSAHFCETKAQGFPCPGSSVVASALWDQRGPGRGKEQLETQG